MIRWQFIRERVFDLYRCMDRISFPIDPIKAAEPFRGFFRFMSYGEMANATYSRAANVKEICGSNFGATHYDAKTGKYICLYNENCPAGRVRWTQAHELGHMVLRHLEDNPPNLIRDGVMVDDLYEMCEKEADAFASTLLAPVPILRELPIDSAEDIQLLCGLSCSASAIRFRELQRCTKVTEWDIRMRDLFRSARR